MIDFGDLTELPYAYVVSTSFLSDYCSYCVKSAKDDSKLRRCSGCHFVYFCDETCQTKGWSDHSPECVALKRVKPNLPTDITRLMARIIWQRHNERRDKKQFETAERTFDDLMTHSEEISTDLTRVEHFGILCHVLKDYVGANALLPIGELLAIFGKIVVNAFSILNDDLNPVGTGLYLRLSVLNHSCDPDAVVVFDGPRAIVRPAKDTVTACDWKEMKISYCELLAPTEERKRQLKDQYYFDCDCIICTDLQKDSKMKSFRCSKNDCDGCSLMDETDEEAICMECGSRHENVSECISCMQALRWDLERLEQYNKDDDFVRILKEGQEMLERVQIYLSPFNVYYVRLLDRLIDAAVNLEKWLLASQFCKQTLPSYRHFYPKFHPNLVLQLLKYAKLLHFNGKLSDARDSFKAVLYLLKHSHGTNHRLYKTCDDLLNNCCIEMQCGTNVQNLNMITN